MTPETSSRPATRLAGDQSPSGPGGADREPEPSPAYVDLAAMILAGDEAPVATRMIEEDEHTEPGEEFGSVLSRFRARLTRSLGSDDARSHHDLGTGYRTMGLELEAIGEFQHAIRKDPESMGAYEMLGRCFLDAGQPGLAESALAQALHLPRGSETDLLGIHYYMGRAREASGKPEAAFNSYRRILAIDADFKDVAGRFRNLSQSLATSPRRPGGREHGDSPDAGSPLSGRGS